MMMLSGHFLKSGDPHSPQKERSQVPPGSMALSVKVRRSVVLEVSWNCWKERGELEGWEIWWE